MLRQLLLTNLRLSVGGVLSQLVQEGWQLSVSYMRQVGGYLSPTRGRITVICQLHDAGERLSVSYMRQDSVVCQLHEPGYRFSAENVRTLSNLKQDDGYLSAT